MIVEALLHVMARSTPRLRRLGLVGDAVALRSRALRRARAWRTHEKRCRAFVEMVARECPSQRLAVVLGSGLARDVPLELLCRCFERVVLVDAVHLLPVRLRARRLGAETVAADLSGAQGGGMAGLLAGRPVDLVVSANLLSQMPLPFRRRTGDWESPEPLSRIGRSHIADLDGIGADVCLLSDVAYRDVGLDGAVSVETPLVDESLLPAPDQSWDWEVAPRGEIDRGFARIHRVCAWRWTQAASSR